MLHGLAEHIVDAHIRAAEWMERSRRAPTEGDEIKLPSSRASLVARSSQLRVHRKSGDLSARHARAGLANSARKLT